MNEELALRDRHDRERIDTILKQAARIDALEAALQQNVNDWRERGRRIEALEAALRKIADSPFTGETAWRQSAKIARAALDQSSPPKAST